MADDSRDPRDWNREQRANHRTYERKGRERLSDLILLCRKCHGRFHAEAA